jgi:hypothetical protein
MRRTRERSVRRATDAGCSIGLLLALAAGCAGRGGDEVAILASRCAFGAHEELGEVGGSAVHALALAAEGEGAVAVWSEEGGLYLRRLDRAGAPRADALRLGPACPGGVDASSGTPLLVACAQPAQPGRGAAGRVIVYAVEGDHAQVLDRFEPVGEDARGVAIAADEQEWVLAWHDARRGDGAVWRVRVPRRSEAPALPDELGDLAALVRPIPLRLSREGWRAGPPSARLVAGRAWIAWAETALDEQGEPIGDVLVQADDEAPRSLATVQHELADPRLATLGERLLVSYRDRRARGRPQGYALWIPPRGETGSLARLAPSNLDSPALVVPCAGVALAVVPRTHSRHERLVSVRSHSLDALEGEGPELQLYEHGEAYEDAAAVCLPGPEARLLVIYAARESDEHEPAHLLSATVACAE